MPSTGRQRCLYLLGPERVELRSDPRPAAGPGEVVVDVRAATTCGTDVKVYRRGGHPRMLTPPCPFGHEMAGVISQVGRGVAGWSEGDRVVVANSASCGRCPACRDGRENLCSNLHYLNGAFAEQISVPEPFVQRSLHRIPNGLEDDVAAMAEPLACVVHGLERMHLGDERRVLVLGGGPIGLLFVHLLASQGHRVTLADPHETRVRMAMELGATTAQVLDRGDDLTGRLSREVDQSHDFDAAIDATGSPQGWKAVVEVLRPGGIANFFGGCAPGSEVVIDATTVHYDELTLLGTYHHRPANFDAALAHLSVAKNDLSRLLAMECTLEEVEKALRAMIRREIPKAVIRP